jgi:aminoglycoside phosphotransferase (APT) family kinase protein
MDSSSLLPQISSVVREIFSAAPIQIERAAGGISTLVYRVVYPNETYYLRMLSDPGHSFAAEAAVHAQLRAIHVPAPEVIHFEHRNAALQRSLLITTAIPGKPVSQSGELGEATLQGIVAEAGRDLARINSIHVSGFGRLRGHAEADRLAGQHQTISEVLLSGLDSAVSVVSQVSLMPSETSQLKRLIMSAEAWLDREQPQLAHGDFSTRHIFQHGGRYTGIIDFGDSRGMSRWYDLGYFHMRDGGLLPYRLLPALLNGYAEIAEPEQNSEHYIRMISLLIGVPLIASALRRGPLDQIAEHLVRRLREDLSKIGSAP